MGAGLGFLQKKVKPGNSRWWRFGREALPLNKLVLHENQRYHDDESPQEHAHDEGT